MREDKKPSLDRLIELQKFLIKFRNIDRVIHFKKSGKQQNENDVEHSYALAMAGWFISKEIPNLNTEKVIKYALVHDLVEVYAGDTFIFADEKSLKSKKEREAKAYLQIKEEWPDFSQMHKLIKSYESKDTPEAKFIYALDKIMPMILNMINDGYTWRTMKMSFNELHKHKAEKVKHSSEIAQYYEEIYEFMKENRQYFTD